MLSSYFTGAGVSCLKVCMYVMSSKFPVTPWIFLEYFFEYKAKKKLEKWQLVNTCHWETMEKKVGSNHSGYDLCLSDLYCVLFAFARVFHWDFCLPDLFDTSPLTISCQTRMSLPLFVSTVYSVSPCLPFGFLSSVFTLLFVYRASGFTLGSCCRAFHNSAYHWE